MQPAFTGANRYDAALSALVPLDEPESVRKLRKRLLTARDLATQALSNSGGHREHALVLHQVIVDVATAHVFRLQDLGALEDAANLCLRLLTAASTIDRMGGIDVQSH